MQVGRTRSVVLVVDDSATQGQRSAQELEAAGFRVRTAVNGRDALEQARRWRPDVIVSDVLMPVMDGFALCREVRRDQTLAHVPLILHTMTYLDPRDEEFALGLGATRFVLKPSDPRQLVAEVYAALGTGHTPIASATAVDEQAFLKGYSERLAAKLEDKVAELEHAYRELEFQSQEELRRAQQELVERTRTENAIRQSDAVKGAIFAATLDCVVTIDDAGRIAEFNPAAERTFGYRRDEVLGKDMADLIVPPALRDQHRRGLARYLATGDSAVLGRRVEMAAMRADGTEFPVELTITRLPTDGTPVFTSFIRDLTQHKLAEAELDRLRRQHQLILASAGEGIFGVDTAGNTTFVNPAAERMLGFAANDLLGRPMHDLVHHTRPDGTPYARDACPIYAALTDGAVHEIQDEVFHREDGSSFPVDYLSTPVRDGDAIVGAVVTFKDTTQRRRAELNLQHQAWHDALTGLPNRSRLLVELEQLMTAGTAGDQQFALLLIDLDRFKEVNDAIGHRYGDLALQQVGARFRAELSDLDTLARLGGDEFAVLVRGADADKVYEVAYRLLGALERPFDLEGTGVEIGGSIGAVLYPEHGGDADTLLRRADVAMYAAKGAGSGCAIYTPGMDRHSPERLGLVAELRHAIEHDELVLHYQPQIDVRSGALVGFEALARWPHPQRGLVSPAEFIPLAEQTRLIRPLSRWAIRSALFACAKWTSADLAVPVAVNLSAHDLQDSGLPDFVQASLDESGLPANRLRLEITESSLMADPRGAREILARLRSIGVRIAIDDFGTGYSSLEYLRNLPVDALKIDRSFVRDMASDDGARAIVRATIDLADDLGLRVVAEGVEDAATWEMLAALGCDVAQGYYFGAPLAASDLTQWAADAIHWHAERKLSSESDAALAERVRERRTRLAAEEEFIARKRAEDALRESEERLRLAVEAAGMATWDWDLAKDTITWAGATEALFGFEPAALHGESIRFIERVHTEDRPLVEAALADALRAGELNVECRILRAGGGMRGLACKGRVIRDPSGRSVRLVGTMVDITARQEAERQREGLAQAEKLRALGQLASGVAHDLNQSLLLIAGYGDLARKALQQPVLDPRELDETLAIVTRAALDGGETVKRLLTFARAKPEGDAEPVDLHDLLWDVAQLTAPRWRDAAQAEGRSISLDVAADSDLVVMGWPSALRDALTNLVFNAVDALPTGGVIRLEARRAGDRVQVRVADSGVGISPEVQARVFEPFFSTKGSQGTGLGLAQVFGIVEQHRGQISLESAPGRGTTFELSFDASAVRLLDTEKSSTPQPVLEQRQLRILAVDDEPAIGSMVARLLRPFRHSVKTATSGEQALECLAAEVFDVVVSDLGLGAGMSGWDLAARVGERWPEVRFIMATGWGAAIDPAEARAKGVVAVLAKPYHPDELQRAIAAAA